MPWEGNGSSCPHISASQAGLGHVAEKRKNLYRGPSARFWLSPGQEKRAEASVSPHMPVMGNGAKAPASQQKPGANFQPQSLSKPTSFPSPPSALHPNLQGNVALGSCCGETAWGQGLEGYVSNSSDWLNDSTEHLYNRTQPLKKKSQKLSVLMWNDF